MQRLQAAGNAVKVATEHLVRAARQAIDAEEERMVIISDRMVSGIAQVSCLTVSRLYASNNRVFHFLGFGCTRRGAEEGARIGRSTRATRRHPSREIQGSSRWPRNVPRCALLL